MENQPEDKKLNIAVLGSTYPRSEDDGQVPWLRESVNRMAARGHRVTVLAPSYAGLRSHEIDGVPVKRFRYAPARWETLTHEHGAPSKVRSPFYKLLAAPYILCGCVAVCAWAWRERFDVIHVHWPFPHGLMTWLPARLFGIRVVANCHGAELALARKSAPICRVLAALLKSADGLLCNSSHTQAEIRKICGREAGISPYGVTIPVEADDESERRQSPGKEEEVPLLLFCGRLIQRKGLDVLIRAFPELLRRRRVRMVITGEGDRKAEWEELAREMGVDDAIEFAGFVSTERLAELYRECAVYVHPAIYDDNGDTEGLGVVLVEALRNRKPVVASAVGGIVDVIVHEETGLLVPEKDEAALVEAITRILDDSKLARRLGETGGRHVRREFDWDRIITGIETLYQECRGQGRASACKAESLLAPLMPGT